MTPENAYESHILQRRLEYLRRKDIVARWSEDPDLDIPDRVLDEEFSEINTFEQFVFCLTQGRKRANAKPTPADL